MSRNPACTVYIGNLDEKVSERVLYEILIQVGHVVDLHIPRDKETNRHKGYAFAEYESEEIADYAVKLFSGLIRLHNKTLKFAISGQDKTSQNNIALVTPQPNQQIVSNNGSASKNGPEPVSMCSQDNQMTSNSAQPVVTCRSSYGTYPTAHVHPQVTASPNGLVNSALSSSNYEYNRHVFGAVLNSVTRSAAHHPIAYPSY